MKQKELYAAPATEVLELHLEGVIAASGDPQWNNAFTSEKSWDETE